MSDAAMRIGLFVPFFPQLSETFIIDQAVGLLEAGHDVRIFCLSGDDSGRVHAAVHDYGLLERTHTLMSAGRHRHDKVLRALVRAIRHFPRSAELLADLRHNDMARSMKVPAAAAAMGLLSIGRPLPLVFDVIQVHFGPMGVVTDALREMRLLDGPMVVTFHGADVLVATRDDPERYQAMFRRTEAFTVNSTFLAQRLAERGAPSDNVFRIPVGVNLQQFSPRPASGDAPRFLTIARLSEGKDVATAIRAIARLKDRGRVVDYTILGDGPLRRELETLAASLDVDDRIDFRGPATHDEVAEALASHHVLVHPGIEASSGWVEAQGLAIVEAQAAGVPVVASAVGGIPETLGEGAGRLVSPGDPAVLAQELDTLLQNRSEWAAMGQRGRRHAQTYFDRSMLLQRTLELYRSLR